MSRWKILGALIMAPVMGGLFVCFLPVIGFVMLGKYVFDSVFRRKRLGSDAT